MIRPETKSDIVSSEAEPLVLVNSADEPVGFLDKSACHDGNGRLHRAFSLFVFNSQGELLIQRRAANKRLWSGFWSNSCCSHPRRNEIMVDAVNRRLEQELGLEVDLAYLYKFEYTANFGDLGTEHELCWVYAGRTASLPVVNTTEIDEWRWISATELDKELATDNNAFTPWFKLEWQRIQRDYPQYLQPAN